MGFFFYFSPLPKSSLKLRMLFKSRADEWEGRRAAIRRELIGSWQRCQGPSLDNLSEKEPSEGRKKKRKKIPCDWKEFSVPVSNKRIQQIAPEQVIAIQGLFYLRQGEETRVNRGENQFLLRFVP